MSTYEWVATIAVLVGGFVTLAQKLNRIEVALAGKVGFRECSEKREKCPCVREMEELKRRIHK